jgi:hypothetical protein
LKLGLSAKRATKSAQSPSGLRIVVQKIKEAFMALMKQAAAEAMLDLLGENGVVTVVDLQ